MIRALWLGVLGSLAGAVLATPRVPALSFTLHKLAGEHHGPTVLVIGGIQGDEPGGFSAAALLATRYRLSRGNLWVVPNLNFESIVRRSRGVHGDMNRKFDAVAGDDPDFVAVRRIQRIITDPAVDFVLNLHDGSGLYRARHIDRMRGPRRWGQSIIIDQERIDAPRYGELGALARDVATRVNRSLAVREHAFHIRNTRTREGDREMAKTLTYFAINRGKPAVGVEATKSVPTARRAFYHLRVLEAYLDAVGLGFERGFPLSPFGVRRTLGSDLRVSFHDGRVALDASRIRRRIGFLPLRRDGPLEFSASNPLLAVTGVGGGRYRLSLGNRTLSVLHVQAFDYDLRTADTPVVVDGREVRVTFGGVARVHHDFVVPRRAGYRVNVIGWKRAGVADDGGHEIRRRDIAERFSVDRDATTFRVEIYHGKQFTGMFSVRFSAADERPTVTAPRLADGAPVLDEVGVGR